LIRITVDGMAGRNDVSAGLRPPLSYRLTARHWLAIDCAAAVIAAGALLFDAGVLHGLRWHAPTGAGAACAAAVLTVAARRIWPVPVLVVVTAVGCLLTAAGRAPLVVDTTLGMAFYMAAVLCRRAMAVAMIIAAEVVLGALSVLAPNYSRSQTDAVRGLLVAGALWFIGSSVRARRSYLAGLADQAAQRERAEAERSRQAVREERVRIARELHDVVAHSLSVVTVQAGVGRRVGPAQPREALRALRAVELTGRGALEELRRILGLLRDDVESPSLSPTPGIEDLGELADSVRAAGIPVGLTVTADAALPPSAALTVYRIVQEALTNVVKHTRNAQAQVRVRIDSGGVRITVTDTGRGPGAPAGPDDPAVPTVPGGQGDPGARHGIVGMRERASAFGGTLQAGRLRGGGFEVRAFLPVAERVPLAPDQPAPAPGQLAQVPDAAVRQPT
jgi:signal transduction histidine kinase